MGLNHRPRWEAAKTRKLVDLVHLRSTPRKADVVTWGYDMSTPSGTRDCRATALLCSLLVLCAITVGGLTNSMQLVYIRADLCKTGDSTLASNKVLMRNITNYYESRQAASTTVNVTATAYHLAKDTYNALGTSFTWPSPYELSETERQALEVEAREGGDDCQQVEVCLGGVSGFFAGAFGDKCKSVDVPCPSIEHTDLLVEYDASQKSLDLFGDLITTDEQFNSTAVAQTTLDKASEVLTVLVRRINFASSIYVLYLAFLVVVTPAFIVYGAKWNQGFFDILANVNKPLWIAIIVLVWYAHELFQSIINSSLYTVLWGNFLKDPCWADPEFLVNTSTVISETCADITSSHNLFSQASANYRYYAEVENTWQAVPDAGGPFYGDPEEDLLQSFPGNCSVTVLLNAIQPGDGTVDWWTLFFNSGALVALMLQIVLANWFITWFSVLRPLTMYRGRVMIPETGQNDLALYREVRSFARTRAIIPFIFHTALLTFLLVNLGASSSESGMWKKVLIAALCLAFLQFVLVPLLIWRPADERTPKVFLLQQQQQQQQQQVTERVRRLPRVVTGYA